MSVQGPSDDGIQHLRVATERLIEQVATLSKAIEVVTILQSKQLEMEADFAYQRDATGSIVRRVSAEADVNARSRRSIRRVLPIGLVMVLSLAVVFVINNQRLSKNCEIRNAQAAATLALLDQVALTQTSPLRDQLILAEGVYKPVKCVGLF